MEILALTILVLFSLIGFVAIFFTTFGTLIILLGSLFYAFITEFSIMSPKVLFILLILYLFGEVLEYVFIILGAKKFGASNAAIVGAIIGGIVGAIAGVSLMGIGLFWGTIFGLFLGAFLVELIIQKDLIRSLKAGAGSVLGRLGSVFAKVLIAITMFAVMALSLTKNLP
ncbi:MAG: hypothetical protein AMJ95_01465 [Omnitrophica WOR_2 bacterium SM23_72]|nr:MAG: hypothetical protein AMJ95_01465 [Omnitrophica WOR_2 bacterium SM23_72]